jgi:hypothetical protein
MTVDVSTFFQFLGALCGGIGAYAAVRAGLAELKARVEMLSKSVTEAHQRIDSILSK